MSGQVRILLSDTGRGLRRDAELLSAIVREHGFETELVTFRPRSERVYRWIRLFDRLKFRLPVWLQRTSNRLQQLVCRSMGSKVLLTIHLQRVHSRYLIGSQANWLIPNPEWYTAERTQYLFLVDRILCKTQDAVRCFSPFHEATDFLGFSGQIPSPGFRTDNRSYRRFLHVAGNNRKKGSAAVVRAWANHPEWAPLDLVIEDRDRLPVIPDNVRVHERIDDVELEALRCVCGTVLAPSEAEGFGHALHDAMAWGQVVVTVDAPPMNELVGGDRGFLVEWTRSKPCHLGTQYFVDQNALEQMIEGIMGMDDCALEERGRAARAWVEQNHEAFRERMHLYLSDLNV